MALSQRLEFRQSQALVMTPQLMQAIKLLQLSSLDLAQYVEGELERNPLLERGSEDDGAAAPEQDAPEVRDDPSPSDWTGDELETSRSGPRGTPISPPTGSRKASATAWSCAG